MNSDKIFTKILLIFYFKKKKKYYHLFHYYDILNSLYYNSNLSENNMLKQKINKKFKNITFNVYIINLDRSTNRLKNIKNNFKHSDIYHKLKKFKAIDYKILPTSLVQQKTNFITRNFLPKSAIAIALSHIQLSNYIYKNDPHPFALILEDDIKPLKNQLYDEIIEIAKSSHYPNWDIIRLHCIGFHDSGHKYKSLKSKIFSGSAASYLISKNGQLKMSNENIKYHIDIQQNFNKNLKIYREPNKKLFTVSIKDSGSTQVNLNTTKTHKYFINQNIPLDYGLGFPIAKLPIIEKNIEIKNIIQFLIFIILFVIYKIKKKIF